jgi:hypothetical protein
VNGRANGKVDAPDSEYVNFTAFCKGYSSQTLPGNSANDAGNPLTFNLDYTAESCFIVSAATGSRHSAEVRRLQEIRARIAGVSRLSGHLISEILREYYQFSPAIATNLKKDEGARTVALDIVVRPLVAWYNLAVALGLEQSDAATIEREAQDVLDVCSNYPRANSIAAVFEAIRSGKPLPADAPQVIHPFAEKAREAARLPSASWALFDPLVRVWSLSTRRANLIDEVSQWLAAVPLETFAPPSDMQTLGDDLRALAGFFDFRPGARQQVGMRLAAAWPQAAPALKEHGFM